MNVFVSWSGGKDTVLSCYRVMQKKDSKIRYLLNMLSEDGKYSRSHGVSAELLKIQAEQIGIPIIQKNTTWQSYESEFKTSVSGFVREGIQFGVFGDIDIQEHRDWVERVCKEIGITPIFPLWIEDREKLLDEFIRAGFTAIVVSARGDILGLEWLGREINREFIEDLSLMKIDLCGENGEYHTFVYNGPIFRNPVEFTIGSKILKDNRWFLELVPKRRRVNDEK